MNRLTPEEFNQIECNHEWEKPGPDIWVAGMRNPLVCRKCGTIKDEFGANSICPHKKHRLEAPLSSGRGGKP